jgi:tellurite resistance protein TerC
MDSVASHGAAALVGLRHELVQHSNLTLSETWGFMMEKDHNVTLFRAEDTNAWITFTLVFFFLITLDNVVLNRNPAALTVSRAVVYTLFWMLMACCFAGWVYHTRGESQAYMWMTGYLLEWMLSFDNLFVFHMIFSVYGTPSYLKHRPLYLGIIGAVVFRLIFIFAGEFLMHSFRFMQFFFGAFLVYTGVKTIATDEDDEDDPSQNPMVLWLQKHFSFVNAYDSKGCFFVDVAVKDNGEVVMPEDETAATENTPLVEEAVDEDKRVMVADFQRHFQNLGWTGRKESRATMLFLVVICLELSDVLFAVDSVSAIVSAVNDLFLAYTSTVFAMLGLRAMFFIIDVLVKLFSLLKYGVGIVLAFVGFKLIVSHWYHIPPVVVVSVLLCSLLGSMLASVIQDRLEQRAALREEEARAIVKVLG